MEKYVLFVVSKGDEEGAERSLMELEALLETAGGEAVGTMIQNLDKPDNVTYLGRGKVDELKIIMDSLEADGVLCDDSLSPSQHRNLADRLDCKVVDRTMLILDIFAGRATTREGKLQVEMAQQKYRASRLTGKGTALSRLGGGIGTRGPGETKLESDRRVIQKRIAKLSSDIKAMKQVRETTRKKRMGDAIPLVAIVGYTNAGKSTLLNHLTGAEILAEDKLFATLDPTTRKCKLPGGQEVLFSDTVGFINKLPHELVDAFRSTLEEAKYADIILHVVDGSSDDLELHIKVVEDTLKELGASDKPVILAYNKADLGRPEYRLAGKKVDGEIEISAKTGDGIDQLFSQVEKILKEMRVYIEEVIPYSNQKRLASIRRYGQILEEKYEEDGVYISAYIPKSLKK